jgi:hypothetical protein
MIATYEIKFTYICRGKKVGEVYELHPNKPHALTVVGCLWNTK